MSHSFSLFYRAGDDVRLEFAVFDEEGVPANITGMTPHFAIAYKKTSPIITTEGSLATAVATVTDVINGIFEVAITGENTQALFSSYPCEAALTDAFGGEATVAVGLLTFTKDLV